MLPEAGERVEMSGAQLRADPALLGDEARSSSLFGDTRHIYARVTGDEAHDALTGQVNDNSVTLRRNIQSNTDTTRIIQENLD